MILYEFTFEDKAQTTGMRTVVVLIGDKKTEGDAVLKYRKLSQDKAKLCHSQKLFEGIVIP